MHMTLSRLHGLMQRALDKRADQAAINRAALALEQRRAERGPSKLARRLRRKGELGLAGAF